MCVKAVMIMAVFILETDDPLRRIWASIFSSSDNSSVYKHGQTVELSMKTNHLLSSSNRQTKVDNSSGRIIRPCV